MKRTYVLTPLSRPRARVLRFYLSRLSFFNHASVFPLPWHKISSRFLPIYPRCSCAQRFEGRLKQVRRNLEDLAHDLLAAKRVEQLETHNFALGYGASAKTTDRTHGVESSEAGVDTKQAHTTPGEEGTASVAAVEADTTDKDTATPVSAPSPLSGGPAAASDPLIPASPQEGEVRGVEQNTTQAAGEAATEEASGGYRGGDRSSHDGTTKVENTDAEEQQQLSSSQARIKQSLPTSTLPGASDKGGLAVAVEVVSAKERQSSISKTLPDSLAQEISDRAFPLALTTEQGSNNEDDEEEGEEKEGKVEVEGKEIGERGGVFCAAFHALAAEAVWAGLNGSDLVEKPPESVWDPRGGDRWGTAAFFAEQIGEREEEATPGLSQQTKALMRQADRTSDDSAGGCSGEHPLSGSSARHATARAVCMAAVSSRRGFLKQATEEAAKEVCADNCSRTYLQTARLFGLYPDTVHLLLFALHLFVERVCKAVEQTVGRNRPYVSRSAPKESRKMTKFIGGNIAACIATK